MSVSEITGLEASLESEDTGTAGETLAATAGSASQAAPAVAAEPDADRISIDVLSKEPVKTFVLDDETGTIRTVQVDSKTGENIPLPTGVSQSGITASVLGSACGDCLAERPLLRETVNSLTNAPQTEVVDPKTGEILKIVDENDFFDLDQALREYARKSLLDKSA